MHFMNVREDILFSIIIPPPLLSSLISMDSEIGFDGNKARGMRGHVASAALLNGGCLRLTSAV